jgi:glycosyltransferase involved in cell wall biosynthesis
LKISIALCTYNGDRFLKELIDSIINQTIYVDEVIVSDDNSIDNTWAILEEYHFKYPDLFKISKNEHNLGPINNFEKTIQDCSGDIIFLADQDDIWLSNKVALTVEYFNNNIHAEAFFSDAYLIGNTFKGINEKRARLWEYYNFNSSLSEKLSFFHYLLYFGNVVTGACLAIRKNSINKIVPFQLKNDIWHDEWIALKLSSSNSISWINEPLIKYRIHSNQQVGLSEKKSVNYIEQLSNSDKLIYWNSRLKWVTKLSQSLTIPDEVFEYINSKIKKSTNIFSKIGLFIKKFELKLISLFNLKR